MITILVLLGQVLELRAREQTSGAIRALLDLAPRTARRIREDAAEEEVSVDLIAAGDRLRVRPGEKIPVDGEVIDGRSAVLAGAAVGFPGMTNLTMMTIMTHVSTLRPEFVQCPPTRGPSLRRRRSSAS